VETGYENAQNEMRNTLSEALKQELKEVFFTFEGTEALGTIGTKSFQVPIDRLDDEEGTGDFTRYCADGTTAAWTAWCRFRGYPS
jgi:hypothetical protein